MGFSYLPDLPPETPDIWTVCDGFHPDIYGNYRTGRLPAAAISAAVGAGAINWQFAFAYQDTAGNGQVLLAIAPSVGNPKWYVWNGSSWDNRWGSGSVSGGGLHCAVQVGNTTLFGGGAGLQSRDATGTSNFAAVSGSPGALALAVNALNIVCAIGYANANWYTSDTNAPTTWSGGESASGALNQTPGTLRALVAFGNDFIAFKHNGVWRGQYVGGTVKWAWSLIDPEKGAFGPDAVVSANERVYFMGISGVYEFDGVRFTRLDDGIWQTLRAICGKPFTSNDYAATATKLVYDPYSHNLHIFALGDIPGTGSARGKNANDFFTVNVVTKKWGYQSMLSNDGTTSYRQVFDLGPYQNSLFVSTATSVNSNVGFYSATSDKIEALSTITNSTDLPGNNYNPKIRTYRLGLRNHLTTVARFCPNWTKSDGRGSDLSTGTKLTITPQTSDAPHRSETSGTTVNMSTNLDRADYIVTAPFQSAHIEINCDGCLDGGMFLDGAGNKVVPGNAGVI